MTGRWLLVLALLGAGILIGALLRPLEDPDGAVEVPVARGQTEIAAAVPASGGVTPGPAIADLRRLLDAELAARQRLEGEVTALRQRIARLEGGAENTAAKAAVSPEPGAGDAAAEEERDRGWFDRQALLDSGMDGAQADELKSYFEQLELERLYLRDRARRENWDRSQLREAMQALDAREEDLRNRLSESAYDAYLYASGQSNRVAVTSVLESAQAGSAGIRPGDQIIRYDNQRIYNWRDLRAATSEGNIGESVTLEIEREGRRIEFYLARGPLGVRTRSLSLAP